MKKSVYNFQVRHCSYLSVLLPCIPSIVPYPPTLHPFLPHLSTLTPPSPSFIPLYLLLISLFAPKSPLCPLLISFFIPSSPPRYPTFPPKINRGVAQNDRSLLRQFVTDTILSVSSPFHKPKPLKPPQPPKPYGPPKSTGHEEGDKGQRGGWSAQNEVAVGGAHFLHCSSSGEAGEGLVIVLFLVLHLPHLSHFGYFHLFKFSFQLFFEPKVVVYNYGKPTWQIGIDPKDTKRAFVQMTVLVKSKQVSHFRSLVLLSFLLFPLTSLPLPPHLPFSPVSPFPPFPPCFLLGPEMCGPR